MTNNNDLTKISNDDVHIEPLSKHNQLTTIIPHENPFVDAKRLAQIQQALSEVDDEMILAEARRRGLLLKIIPLC